MPSIRTRGCGIRINRNPIKGDYPILGGGYFFVFTAAERDHGGDAAHPGALAWPARRAPASTAFSDAASSSRSQQNFRFSLRPVPRQRRLPAGGLGIRITPEFNINYALARENGLLELDVRQGYRRTDSNVGLQELFFEKRLFSERAHFDFTSLRLGHPALHQRFPRVRSIQRRTARRAPVRHLPQQRVPVQPGVVQHAGEGHQQRAEPLAQRGSSGIGRQPLLERFSDQGLHAEFQRAVQSRPAVSS